jgi:hypothetical protein
MDHHEQHHQHHDKARAEHKKHGGETEGRADKTPSPIHPAWFVALGVVLMGLVFLVWMLAF